MPVWPSGVMLVANTVPKGVGRPRPPANAAPPALVWQLTQLPIAARLGRPGTRAASQAGGAGGAIGAMEGRQAKAKPASASTISTASVERRPRRRGLEDGAKRGSWNLLVEAPQLRPLARCPGCVATKGKRRGGP